MQSTTDKPKPRQPLSILLIGGPGGGKTTFLLQFPGLYVLDCDTNLDGPENYLRRHGKFKDYEYDQVAFSNGKPLPVHECYDNLMALLTEAKSKPYQTVAIDGLTMINEYVIQKVLSKQSKKEMEARDWQPFKTHLLNLLVGKLRSLGKDTIVTCHEFTKTKPDPKNIMQEQIIGYTPAVQGGITDYFGGFFTDMWRMTAELAPGDKLEFKLTGQRTGLSDLKNSIGLPPVLKNPTYADVEPYIKGEKYYV